MYRPSKRPPKGVWARHLQEQRRLRDLSAVEAFELVYERIGWSPKSRTAYVAIDAGDRQPKGHEITVLGAEFGWPTETAETEEIPDLATALSDLARELAAIRQERAAWERGVLAVLRSFEDGQVPIELLTALAPQPREGAQQ